MFGYGSVTAFAIGFCGSIEAEFLMLFTLATVFDSGSVSVMLYTFSIVGLKSDSVFINRLVCNAWKNCTARLTASVRLSNSSSSNLIASSSFLIPEMKLSISVRFCRIFWSSGNAS